MNRERKPSESLKQYHINLKAEARAMKERLAGSFIHVSKTNAPNEGRGTGRTYRKPS